MILAAGLDRAWSQLPDLLGGHVTITVLSLALGVLISVPLGLWLTRVKAAAGPALAVAGVIQTVPSLALLALMVPVLELLGEAGLEVAAESIGFDYSAFGFLPAVLALTLYSILPILRNTVTGVLGIDAHITEAARGVGMTSRQSLFRVELPLAMPVILAGVRTSAVWTVGIATLATPVGQECLGNYIFSGLQTRNSAVLLFGVAWAAALALIIDGLLGRVQAGLEKRRSVMVWTAGGLLGVVLLAGLLLPVVQWQPTERGESADASAAKAAEELGPIRVGSKTFTEQYILADAIESRLQKAGFDTERVDSLGSTVIFQQLVSGELDVYVDYTGTIWANHMKRSGTAPPARVLEEVAYYMAREHSARSLGSLGFENAYAFAVRKEQADALGLESIADLREHASNLAMGGDYEWFERPEWVAVRDAYQLNFKDQRSFDSSLMYQAVRGGDVDVISAFSSDGRIHAFNLQVLSDPRVALPPYDAVVLLGPRVADSSALVSLLSPMIGKIDLETMQRINAMVDVEGKSVSEAAAELLRVVDSE